MTVPNIEILAYEDTPLGPLCLRRRTLLSPPHTRVTEVTLNHEFLMSSVDPASERALARLALDMRLGSQPASPLQVLVGGLGLGYTAAEALASPLVGRVEVIEFLPQVMDWMVRGLVPLAPQLNADPRFAPREGDVYALLAGAPARRWDLILIDVDHSPDERLAADSSGFLYTEDGLAQAALHLEPGGVLAVWSYDESPRLGAALRHAFPVTRVEAVAEDWVYLGQRDGAG